MTRYLVNPLYLFLGVWSTAAILYLGGVLAGTFPEPKPLTIGAVLLNIGVFSLGYLTWSLFQDLRSGAAGSGRGEADLRGRGLTAPPLTRMRLVRALQVTLAVGLVALLMELYRLATLAAHFNTTWLYLLTHPEVFRLRIVMFISSSLFQTSSLVMLLSITSAIFSLGFVFLGLFLYLDRTRWKYFYLSAFLLISLVIGLLHLSRYEVTANILYLVLAYCFLHAQDSARREAGSFPSSHVPLRTSHFKLMVPIAAIVLLFVLIDLLLRKSSEYAQANRLQGFAFHLYWYLASPLAAFNEFLATFSGVHEWGQNTFLPFYKWLCRFGLALQTDISFYGEKVYLPYVANVYTYLRSFYADFGLLGVAIVPYVLGGLTALVERQARRYTHYLNLHIVLLMLILFSFYNYFLVSNQIYLQILFGFLFFRYELPTSNDLGSPTGEPLTE
jgi:oligosaccharide repeat unit polymerase